MQVIQTKEHRVCHSIVLSKNPLHLGQQYAAEEKFLAQEIVEDTTDQGNSQEPPLALELGGSQLRHILELSRVCRLYNCSFWRLSSVGLSSLKRKHVPVVCAGKVGRSGHQDDDDG